MRIHACSVAFRHLTTITARDLAHYTLREGFDGLEIWAPHARALLPEWRGLTDRPRVPMLAGYLPVGEATFTRADACALVALTGDWGAGRLRVFAGGIDSALASPDHRARIIRDLTLTADLAADRGIRLALETHPQTLADGLQPVLDLLDALDHPAIGINFDVLHVWESGCDPARALDALRGRILHAHLKTVTSRRDLTVFQPGNIHDPQGSRVGICPLFEGAVDYGRILPLLRGFDASLEWFGPKPALRMAEDLRRARQSLSVTA